VSQPGHELDCEQLADGAAYVLGALDEGEARVYREHLAECLICRAELARLQPVADSLAAGVPQASAPRGLRARIMAPVHAECEQLGAAGYKADGVAPARPRLRRRLAPAFAAVLSVGVGFAIGAFVFKAGSRGRTEVIDAVVAAPGHRATAQLRRSGSNLELVVVGMPAPPPGDIYEVWLEHGAEAPKPTDALFSVTKTGDGSVGVPGDLDGVSKVLVTSEPLGGTPKPTREPVIVGSI
jgi:Anti-sigma-K factor rskA